MKTPPEFRVTASLQGEAAAEFQRRQLSMNTSASSLASTLLSDSLRTPTKTPFFPPASHLLAFVGFLILLVGEFVILAVMVRTNGP